MYKPSVDTRSVWMEQALPSYSPLDRALNVDIVVVGAGLTGITTAYLLRNEGARVALIDRGKVAAADTARTTAHLTYVTDYRLSEIAKRFGNDGAKAFWEAGSAAIDTIATNVKATSSDCDFRWVPGHLHLSLRGDDSRVDLLQQDAALANELGFDAMFIEDTPIVHKPGVRFANQAKFHPRKYLASLLQAFVEGGGYVFEDTNFESVEESPFAVRANGQRITCDYLVVATHNPLMGQKGFVGATLFQTKLALYTSHVIGARMPKGSIDEGLYWDTHDPYDYLRVDSHADHQYVIFGGDDVKTGQEKNSADVFSGLEARLRTLLPEAQVEHRWMGQIVETDDGLPFIGENASREFIATGYAGNGFTFGTLAAMMARDHYLDRKNPWADLLRVDRKPFHGGLWRYVQENFDYPYHLLRDRLARAPDENLNTMANGEGRIVALNGRKVAVYRDSNGAITTLSPVCTHMKCLVTWNAADKTWDCPCHGSRFHPDGAVLSGPAQSPLARENLHAK